jgi:hypothetical protein
MKVSCFTCKYFIKTLQHISEKNISKDADLSLCSKIGFRIFDHRNPNIYCNFYSPIEPIKVVENKIGLKEMRMTINLYLNNTRNNHPF